jgi:hypothetical protein
VRGAPSSIREHVFYDGGFIPSVRSRERDYGVLFYYIWT